MKVLLCLYGIRNQLFHRTAFVDKELDIGRMRLACFALATIVRISISSYVVKYSDLKLYSKPLQLDVHGICKTKVKEQTKVRTTFICGMTVFKTYYGRFLCC